MNSFDSTHETQTIVSTLQENKEATNHVYTYIHTYMEKRKITENTKRTNVVFYDGKDLQDLKVLASRNNTDVSSIVSNLVREFNLITQDKSPQKTLFNFEKETILDFNLDSRSWNNYLRECSKKELEGIRDQIVMIDKTLGKYLR